MTTIPINFEDDVIGILESAHGAIKPGDLYRELRARGHVGSDPTLRQKLRVLASVEQCSSGGLWTLVDYPQGQGPHNPLSITQPPFPLEDLEPPVVRSERQLPIERLSWEDFELLCVYMLDEFCSRGTVQPYGLRGQDQLGIDVLGLNKSTGNYDVTQCKRYASADFNESDFAKAVERFLKGAWKNQAGRLILAITKNTQDTNLADEEVRQRRILEVEGIEFEVWDIARMTRILQRDAPHLIDAFFGKQWAEEMGCPDARRRVYLLDATSPLSGVKTNNSYEAFELAAFKVRTKSLGGRSYSAGLDDVQSMDPALWEAARQRMESTVRTRLEHWSEEDPDAGVAVFPLARVPLLFCLGKVLGNQHPVDLYRWERNEKTWCWREEDEDLGICAEPIEPQLKSPRHIGVLVSITTKVHEGDVRASIQKQWGDVDVELWRIIARDGKRGRNNIHHKEQLARFREVWTKLQDTIEEEHGLNVELHVFISAAAPIAVSMGQALLTRARPTIHLYEFSEGTHHRVLTV